MQNNLPQGWIRCKLGEAFNIERGGSPRPIKEYLTSSKDGINWIKIGDTKNTSKYIFETKEKIKPEGMRHSRFVTVGDLILSNSMSFGRPYIMKTSGCIHDGWVVFRNQYKIATEEFLYYMLSSQKIYSEFSRVATGSTVKNLNIDRIKGVNIIIPPLNEQKRIVEKIESEFKKIDEGLEHLEQAKEQIKQYRQSVLKSAFEGKLTQQNPDDEPAEILLQKINPKANFNYNNKLPQGWVECQLGEVFNIVNGDRGKNYPAKNKLHTSGIPFVSAINIQNSELFIENLLYLNEQQYDLLRSGKITKGDSLLCIRGSIGKHCIYPFDTGAIASSMVIIRKSLPNMNKFLFYYLESFCFKQEVKKYDNGTAQPNLSASDLKRFNYLLPPLNEQKRIVEEIEKRFAVADEVEKVVEQNIEKVKQLKQSILKKAFEGRLVPQDPTDEPASKLLEKIKQERNKNDRK